MNEQQNQGKLETVTNYRSEITLDGDTTCTFTGTSLQAVQEKIRKLLAGPKLRFELSGGQSEPQSLSIFHDSHFNAQEPIGWIAAYDIPVNLSVRMTTQSRLARQKAA